MNKVKYICTKEREVIIFPETITHDTFKHLDELSLISHLLYFKDPRGNLHQCELTDDNMVSYSPDRELSALGYVGKDLIEDCVKIKWTESIRISRPFYY